MRETDLWQNIISLYGEKGQQWLDQLPQLLRQYEQELGIKIHPPFANLTYNYVAPTTLTNGNPAVFKCGIPNPELTTEIAALSHFAGNGAVRLINADAKTGWLLIEKLEPGAMLVTLTDDDEATTVAVNVMQKLWKPIEQNTDFPNIATWLAGFQRLYKGFNGGTGPFPRQIVEYADQLAQELLQSMGNTVLLHGDLQHYNILSSRRGEWLAIDPKGVIGEPEYEIGALMRNPMPRLMAATNLKKLFLRRIDIIAEITGFERFKIIGWSFCQAVLAAWWIFEDINGDIKPLMKCAEVLAGLPGAAGC